MVSDVLGISESKITRIIVMKSAEYLEGITDVDVVIVGAGPAGLTAGYYLSKRGYKTLIVERRISFGGGIGGGGMLFPKILVSHPAESILRDIQCQYEEVEPGIYVVDPAELMAKLASSAMDAGAKILLGVTVDDVVYRLDPLRIVGVVLQWSAVIMSGIHVDPLSILSQVVIDATGHEAEVLTIASRKIPELNIDVPGEKSMYVSLAEKLVVEKTGRVVPGLYVAGMSVAALHGLPRMGPIFSSMLLSGKRVAEVIDKDLKGSSQRGAGIG